MQPVYPEEINSEEYFLNWKHLFSSADYELKTFH